MPGRNDPRAARHRPDGYPASRGGRPGGYPQDPLRRAVGRGGGRGADRPCHGRGPGEDPGRRMRRLHPQAGRSPGPPRGGNPLPATGTAEDRLMSEQPSKPSRMGESLSKSSHPYTQILQLNQELVANLQGLVDEHEARKKELDELKFPTTRPRPKSPASRRSCDTPTSAT